MKTFLKFITILIIIYFLLSLPMILGYGVIIDFVSDVSLFAKAKAYFTIGMENNYETKLLISFVSALVFTAILKLIKNKLKGRYNYESKR